MVKKDLPRCLMILPEKMLGTVLSVHWSSSELSSPSVGVSSSLIIEGVVDHLPAHATAAPSLRRCWTKGVSETLQEVQETHNFSLWVRKAQEAPRNSRDKVLNR